METQLIGAYGAIHIPPELLEQANLPAGAGVVFSVRADGYILLHRADRDPDQAWFWTEEWQKGEREADEDIKAGRVDFYGSDEEFRAALIAHMKEPSANI